ncbi:M16 family metallopeptidase [Streptomyces sp. NBC_00503]|uniref:M16 family metallopeptidase n=1 Tax=Streptomyces sp. NBC_00503 TaxID=2903659 RepID=UPI002E810EFD|nr:insulinase family protein [Streptomyces sp. NBC_00503]WUD83140.1 insulinase family protein [Streptomyces sp. NBC_00503]
MTTDTDGIVTTTVNGIRTLLAPRPGPLTAGLLFRVGSADETLATSGITHLVEHLALHHHGLGDLHYNGATAPTYTHFHVTGSPADITEYLNGVCAALRDLPMDRLETEKEILRTEAAGKNSGPAHSAALWRYGANSYGLVAYPEFGLFKITESDVRDWARTRFTRENAVLWIAGDAALEGVEGIEGLGLGLDLGLPSGEWRPAPEPTSALPRTPAYFHGEDGGVCLTAVVPRSTGATLFAGVLSKELFRELRQKGGYSYTAAADYTMRDADHATVLAYADSLPEKQDALVGAFVDVLAKLRAGRIEESDLDSVRASALARFEVPDLAAAWLPGRAVDLLLGRPHLSTAGARAEIEAVTAADLRKVARAVWADALMQVPDRAVDWAGLTAAPSQSAELVTGRRHPSVEDDAVYLVVGTEGISGVSAHGRATVRYADCVLLRTFPDGGLQLIGRDGIALTVEPTLYRIRRSDLSVVDASVPPSAVVAMEPRDPSRIPRPGKPTLATSWRNPRSGLFTAAIWGLGVLSVALAVVTWVLAFRATDRSIAPGDQDWRAVKVTCLLTVACAAAFVTRLRRRGGRSAARVRGAS